MVLLLLGLCALAGTQFYEEQTHFLVPEFLRLGILHKDPMSFITFVATIKNGASPGSVMNGPEPFAYHFGTMYFVAALATLTKSSAALGEAAAHHLVFIPLIFFHLSQAVISTRTASERVSLAVPFAVTLMFILTGANWPVIFYSESSAATVPALFLFLSFVHAWQTSNATQRARWTSLLVLAPLLAICLIVKLPTGFMLCAFASYLTVTLLAGSRAPLAVVLYLAACATVVILVLALAPRAPSLADLRTVLIEAGIAGVMIILLTLLRRPQPFHSAVRRWFGSDPVSRGFALWFIGAAAGGAIIASINFPYNARYLFNTLTIAAIPALSLALARRADCLAPLLSGRPVLSRLGQLAAILGFLALLELTRLQPTAVSGRIAAANAMVCAAVDRHCSQDRAILPKALPAEIPDLIQASLGTQLIAQAGHLADRGAEAFFVPHDADPVWQFLLSGDRLSDNLQFLPAVFGRPMLFGLPPSSYGLDISLVNVSLPGTYDESDRSGPISDQDLCRHASSFDIEVVGVIAAPSATNRNRLIKCRDLR